MGVGDVGNGVVGDGVGEIADGLVGDGVVGASATVSSAVTLAALMVAPLEAALATSAQVWRGRWRRRGSLSERISVLTLAFWRLVPSGPLPLEVLSLKLGDGASAIGASVVFLSIFK